MNGPRSARARARSLKKGIGREVQDLLFVFLNPGETLLKGHLLLLPITIGEVDRQPVCSAFAQRLAVGKLDQRPSDVVGLWIHQLRHGVDPSAMIHLGGKIESLFARSVSPIGRNLKR